MVDIVIRDPATSRGMNVTPDGHGETEAVSVSTIEHISDKDGLSFSWTSTFATGGTDIEVISIQNDSTEKVLHIDKIVIGAIILAVFTLNRRTSGTAGGTTITGVPLNFDAGKTAEATAFGNASVTGTLAGDIVTHIQVPADETIQIDLHGAVILGKDDVIYIESLTNTTIYVSIFGHFDD